MYETTRFGWTRTPEELDKIKKSKVYRLRMNWVFLKNHAKYVFIHWEWNFRTIKWDFEFLWYNFKNLIFNRNNF